MPKPQTSNPEPRPLSPTSTLICSRRLIFFSPLITPKSPQLWLLWLEHVLNYQQLSLLEATRRHDTSLDAFRRAHHNATLTTRPTAEQHTLRYLPSVALTEDEAWFAWRTTLLEAHKTTSMVQLPAEFRAIINTAKTSNMLPKRESQLDEVVACKMSHGAKASISLTNTAGDVTVAELRWNDNIASENWYADADVLNSVKTLVSFPAAEASHSAYLEDWPGFFSKWMEETLQEFVRSSCQSRAAQQEWQLVWEEAGRVARASIATSITDDEVDAALLRLSSHEEQ